MNQTELHRKLIAAARVHQPSDRVPYAFEKRILARLRDLSPRDPWAFWGRALWRAAGPCIAIMLLFSAWSWLSPAGSQTSDWSQELENTVLAAADQETSTESVW